MFIGQFEHNIDKKGRLFIPAKFKDAIGETFIVSREIGSKNCLSLYTISEWEKLNARIEKLPYAKAREVRLYLHPNSSELTPDAQGRIIIPTALREYANLDESAIIIGTGQNIEIWNKEKWAQESAAISAEHIMDILDSSEF